MFSYQPTDHCPNNAGDDAGRFGTRLDELSEGAWVYAANAYHVNGAEQDVFGQLGSPFDTGIGPEVTIYNGRHGWIVQASAIGHVLTATPILGVVPTGTRVCVCVADWHPTRSFVTGITGRHFGMPELGNQGVVVTDDDGHEWRFSRYARVAVVPDQPSSDNPGGSVTNPVGDRDSDTESSSGSVAGEGLV